MIVQYWNVLKSIIIIFIIRYTQSETLGTNQYQCFRCGQNQEATKQLSIKKLPPVLSFQIKVDNLHLTSKAI